MRKLFVAAIMLGLSAHVCDSRAATVTTPGLTPPQCTKSSGSSTIVDAGSCTTTSGLTAGQCVVSSGTTAIDDSPCVGRNNVISLNTSPRTLLNTECGSVVRNISSINPIVVNLPASPLANCEYTFEPGAHGFYLNFNGTSGDLPGYNGLVTQWKIPFVDVFRTNNAATTLIFNGTNWEQSGFSSPVHQTTVQPKNTSQYVHGQVYFQWNASASQFELCPLNGPGGLIVDAAMRPVPSDWLTLAQSGTQSSHLNYFYAAHTPSDVLTVSSVGNNGSGLVRLGFTGTVLGNVGNKVAISCYSIDAFIEANGNYTGQIASTSTIDLLNTSSAPSPTSSGGTCEITRLEANLDGHSTYGDGVEIGGGATPDQHYTLVGIAYVGTSNAVNDSLTKRDVASWFNRRARPCINTYTSDHTWTSTSSWGEPGSEIQCEFVTFDDPNENAQGWSINGMFGNSGVGSGTLVTAGFDGTTPETQIVGEKGTSQSLGVHGSKSGLTEDKHYITLLAKTLTGGTSTIFGTTPATTLDIQLWQ